jgi:hypothetical protein
MLWLRVFFLGAVVQLFGMHQVWAQPNAWQELPAQEVNRTAGEFDVRSTSSLAVDVVTLRHPSFGSFYCGSGGGSITIETDGTRTAEGDVILMSSGMATAPAVFEVRCEPYTMVQMFRDEEFFLRGSNGDLLRVTILSTVPAFPVTTPSNSGQGFTVTASVRLNLDPGQTLSSGTYVGMFQTTWVTE